MSAVAMSALTSNSSNSSFLAYEIRQGESLNGWSYTRGYILIVVVVVGAVSSHHRISSFSDGLVGIILNGNLPLLLLSLGMTEKRIAPHGQQQSSPCSLLHRPPENTAFP